MQELVTLIPNQISFLLCQTFLGMPVIVQISLYFIIFASSRTSEFILNVVNNFCKNYF